MLQPMGSQIQTRLSNWTRSLIVCACSVGHSCLTLWNPMDCSPPGSSVLGIPQIRILKWVANSYSRGSSQPRGRSYISCISWFTKGLFTTEPSRSSKPPYNHEQKPTEDIQDAKKIINAYTPLKKVIKPQRKKAKGRNDETVWWLRGKESACSAGDTVMQVPAWSLSWEEPLEKEMATHFNILARGIPWTEESGGYSPGGLKQLDMTK